MKHKNWITLLLALAVLAGLLGGCGKSKTVTQIETDPPAEQGTEIPEDTTYDSGACAAFGLQLLEQVLQEEPGENPVISPLSAYLALAMTANGAEGQTLDELEQVLGNSLAQLNAYSRTLQDLSQATGGDTKLSIANSVWVDEQASLTDVFRQAAQGVYRADLFSGQLDAEETRKAINDWVSEKTADMIPELLNEPLSEDTRLALLNALYLQAKWQTPFDPEYTAEDDFYLADGTTQKADFMYSGREDMVYFKLANAQGVYLPYNDGRTGFVALLPDEGVTPAQVLQELEGQSLTQPLPDDLYQVELYLPKFSLNYTQQLTRPLQAMGISSLFSTEADLSRLATADAPLCVSSILQKVRVEVNEEETKAAAATIEDVDTSAAPDVELEYIELRLDRPFVYAIVDRPTATPLFAGVLTSPEQN